MPDHVVDVLVVSHLHRTVTANTVCYIMLGKPRQADDLESLVSSLTGGLAWHSSGLGDCMKVHARSISRLTSVLICLLISIGAAAAQTILPSGPFGFLLATSYTDPTNQGGAAIQGVMSFDGAGNVNGQFTLEYGSGGPLPVETITGTLTGSYTSNPNGSGSITLTLSNGISLTLDMVINDKDRGLELTATSCSGAAGINLSQSVLSGIGVHALGSTPKSVAALNGSYGAQFTFSPQPSRSVDVVTFDGAGNVTLSGTFIGAGPNISSATYPGTYTVKRNATGTITLAPQPGQAAQTFAFVITNEGGSGLLMLQTNRLGDGVSFGTARLQ